MASRLVQIKSVEQFRQMHEAGLARYVLHNDEGRVRLEEPATLSWAGASDAVIVACIGDKRFWYYVEEDESPITGDE